MIHWNQINLRRFKMARKIEVVERTVRKRVNLVEEIKDALKSYLTSEHMFKYARVKPELLERFLHEKRGIRFSSDPEFINTIKLMINKGIIKNIIVDDNLTVTEIVLKRDPDELLSDKEKRILSIVKDNPGGITLPEIAYVMGVAFVTITKDVKSLLVVAKRIKKEDNKYFYFPA